MLVGCSTSSSICDSLLALGTANCAARASSQGCVQVWWARLRARVDREGNTSGADCGPEGRCIDLLSVAAPRRAPRAAARTPVRWRVERPQSGGRWSGVLAAGARARAVRVCAPQDRRQCTRRRVSAAVDGDTPAAAVLQLRPAVVFYVHPW